MQLLLNKNELLDLGIDLRSVSVHCQEGSLWLTQTGDGRDHLLHAGQSHTFTQRGRVLVTAMADSRLQLNAEPKGAVNTSFWRPFFSRLWLNLENGKRVRSSPGYSAINSSQSG